MFLVGKCGKAQNCGFGHPPISIFLAAREAGLRSCSRKNLMDHRFHKGLRSLKEKERGIIHSVASEDFFTKKDTTLSNNSCQV